MQTIDGHFLQCYSLFGGITDEQMKNIIPHLKEQKFMKDDIIIQEGEDGDSMYFICDGSVEVLKREDGPDGVELEKVAELHKGEAFGEMELIDIQHRAATVRALEPVSTLLLTNKDLYSIYHTDLKAYTIIILNLARELSRRLRKTTCLAADNIYSQHHKPGN